jgi:outer membrane protein OmpA-like peptidoglycan-associated protein
MSRLISFVVFVLFLQGNVASQQNYSTKSPRAIDFYEQAKQSYIQKNYSKAIESLEKAIKEDPNFIEAVIGLSDVYTDLDNPDKAINYLVQSIKMNSTYFPPSFYNLGNLYFSQARYSDALESFKSFLNSKSTDARMRSISKRKILNCEFGIISLKHPVPFEPENLGDSVNTKYDEYWPSLSADEQTLVITVKLPVKSRDGVTRSEQEDFYVSYWKENGWSKVKDIGPPLNTPDNEGAQSLSVDGKRMYFTACNRPDGIGNCDIYVSFKREDKWSEPVNLGEPINSTSSEKQPSISPDGRTLYFISNRAGGKGGFDIYSSHLSDDGQWEEPINLGDSINTPYNEQSPFIHPDNQTLYFSSEGWVGMGGYDIFLSHRKVDGTWSKPVNLGYPINTQKDEIGLFVNAKGNKAYFSSSRKEGRGLDIYSFDLYPGARPIPVSYMKGTVLDAETKQKLSARFELIDLQSGKLINQAISGSVTGSFLVTIPTNKNYALNVSKDGYLFYSDHFAMADTHDALHPYIKDVPLKRINVGEIVVLKNIFFETNSFELKEESVVELNKLRDFLQKNKSVKIELSGHTDNIGSDSYNQKLSENRANSVKEFLLTQGLQDVRIVSKGYGKTQPVASNQSEEGRAQNRRTEFKIIGN